MLMMPGRLPATKSEQRVKFLLVVQGMLGDPGLSHKSQCIA